MSVPPGKSVSGADFSSDEEISLHDSDSSISMEVESSDNDCRADNLDEDEQAAGTSESGKENVPMEETPRIEVHGKWWKNVFPIESQEIEPEMWLLCSFQMEQSKKLSYRYFIGKVISIDTEIVMTFLRSKLSVKASKNMFYFPENHDVATVQEDQIIGRVIPVEPEHKGRRQNLFYFDVNL